MRLLFIIFNFFHCLRKVVEEMMGKIGDKLTDLIGVILYIIFVLPLLILEKFFDFLYSFDENARRYAKYSRAFKKWYKEHEKELEK